MGISANWISVGGLSKADVLARMGLEETGEVLSLAECWFDRDADSGVAVLPSGRVLVLAAGEVCPMSTVEEVSAGCELVWAARVDTVNYVKTIAFRDRRQVWSVERDPNLPGMLKAAGELPPAVQTLITQADDGDAYEIALRVSGEMGRYDPEDDLDGFDARVELLQSKGATAHRLSRKRPSRDELRIRFPWLAPGLTASWVAIFFWWELHLSEDTLHRNQLWINVGLFGWVVILVFGLGYSVGGVRLGVMLVKGITIALCTVGLIFVFVRFTGAWLRDLG